MMTAQEFIDSGFRVSTQIPQAEIDRAVNDVTAAYVARVTADTESDEAKAAIMQLAFILLCQCNTSATRAGGKLKLSPQLSDNAQARQADFDNAHRLLSIVQSSTGGVAGKIDKMVDDICLIYMRSFVSMV